MGPHTKRGHQDYESSRVPKSLIQSRGKVSRISGLGFRVVITAVDALEEQKTREIETLSL